MIEDIKRKTILSLIWRFAERCGAQFVSFIVSIIVARLLCPDDYGLIALVSVFVNLSQVFVDSGLGNALIQKKEADQVDFSTVFYFNIVLCIVAYAVVYICSPYIAMYYEMPLLLPVIRVQGITIIVAAIKNVQQAYVSKRLEFKKFFFATIGGTMVAALVGITMAYCGFGVWALVAQSLTNLIIDTVILWITVKWHPTKHFSFDRLKSLYSYGWKLFISAIIETLYGNLRQIIIGKMYSSSDLAFYNKGNQFPSLIVTNINTSIDSVLLPAMAEKQDEQSVVKNMTRRAIKTSSFIMWPLMIGLFVASEPLVKLLLTDKWTDCVPYMKLFCIIYAFQPIHTSNLSALKALGRSDIFLKLEIIKKLVGIVILIFFIPRGVFAIAISLLIYNFIAQIINSFPNRKLLKYSYGEQIKDIIPYVFYSSIMGIMIAPLKRLNSFIIIVLILQVLFGALIYFFLVFAFKDETFLYITKLIKTK